MRSAGLLRASGETQSLAQEGRRRQATPHVEQPLATFDWLLLSARSSMHADAMPSHSRNFRAA
jgi:hypothetical protein